MGTVYRKQTTRPLPIGAEFFTKGGQRFACWKVGKRTRTAKLTTGRDGSERIVTESPTWLAKYRDGQGFVCEVSTGCKDETAARAVLAALERRTELVQSGVMTSTENDVADHQAIPLARHFDAYDVSMRANGVGETYRANTLRYLKRLAMECGFAKLADLRRDVLESWLVQQAKASPDQRSMSARTRNAHRDALVTFGNWYVENRRLTVNPFQRVPKANEKADPRRQRRALTEAELSRLLIVARL